MRFKRGERAPSECWTAFRAMNHDRDQWEDLASSTHIPLFLVAAIEASSARTAPLLLSILEVLLHEHARLVLDQRQMGIAQLGQG